MKAKPVRYLEQCRVKQGELGSSEEYGNNGAFCLMCEGEPLHVVASDQADWDHVSVSCETRCPTWGEMLYVRDLFFRADEWVLQYMPPRDENINNHPYCLHMWRPQSAEIPQPDRMMV